MVDTSAASILNPSGLARPGFRAYMQSRSLSQISLYDIAPRECGRHRSTMAAFVWVVDSTTSRSSRCFFFVVVLRVVCITAGLNMEYPDGFDAQFFGDEQRKMRSESPSETMKRRVPTYNSYVSDVVGLEDG